MWLHKETGLNCTQTCTCLIVGSAMPVPPRQNKVKSALIHFTSHTPIKPPQATSLSLTRDRKKKKEREKKRNERKWGIRGMIQTES